MTNRRYRARMLCAGAALVLLVGCGSQDEVEASAVAANLVTETAVATSAPVRETGPAATPTAISIGDLAEPTVVLPPTPDPASTIEATAIEATAIEATAIEATAIEATATPAPAAEAFDPEPLSPAAAPTAVNPVSAAPTATAVPITESAQVLAANGGEVYTLNCARCHAENGFGTDQYSATLFGVGSKYTTQGMIEELTNGHPVTFGFADRLSAEEIASVVAYVKATFP